MAAGLVGTVERRSAGDAEVEAAFAALEAAPGVYFGCDAGVAGLHPLQATLLDRPSLAFAVFTDGLRVDVLDAAGAQLLRRPELAAFVAAAGRRAGGSPLPALRAFLSAFDGVADALLVGALQFDAHRLGSTGAAADVAEASAAARVPDAGAAASIGVFYFSPTPLRRDGDGRWQRLWLRLAGELASQGDRGEGIAASGDPGATGREAAGEAGAVPADDFLPGGYAQVVARAVQRLAGPELVSLTLSQSFRRRVGAVSAARGFAALRRANPAPATFFINADAGERVFGASPDLQLVVRGRAVEALPVCGTVARRPGPVGEAESLRRLLNEDVDAASLAVCSDALRNDLAPLCEPGSLALIDRQRPMALATVVHTVDRLRGRLRPGVDAWDAIVATAAPAMVTGTPRRLALAAIAELEAGPRGWYGGLMVQVGADGAALVGTILRAAAIRDGVAEVRAGGDLLADSDPAREEAESRLKAVSLWRALGLSVAGDLGAASAADAPARAEVPAGVVVLCDAGDPFLAAVADTLGGLGLKIAEAGGPTVLVGADAARCADAVRRAHGLVALGDAAARVLHEAGFAVLPVRPEHGRPLRGLRRADTPGPALPERLSAARYATLALDRADGARLGAGWLVWHEDEAGAPLVLAHPPTRTVCLLYRPDSLLSDQAGRDLLREAIAFADGRAPVSAP